MRKRSNKDLCPSYPGRQWKQMFTFKGNKFDMFYQTALHHEEFEDVTTDAPRRVVVLFRVDFNGYVLLWFTCKMTRRRSCLTFAAPA